MRAIIIVALLCPYFSLSAVKFPHANVVLAQENVVFSEDFESGISLSPSQFVDQLDENAGGVLSQSERDQLISELTGASDVSQGWAGVLRKVAEDQDLQRNEFNRAFVLMQ